MVFISDPTVYIATVNPDPTPGRQASGTHSRPDCQLRAPDLPVARSADDIVVLDVPAVLRRVRAADVQLGAGLRELEPELRLLDRALRLRVVNEGRHTEVRERLVREAEDAVVRLGPERVGERRHRGKRLVVHGEPGDTDGVRPDGAGDLRAVAVTHGERVVVVLRRRGCVGVVLVFLRADVLCAVGRRQPEVRGPGCSCR